MGSMREALIGTTNEFSWGQSLGEGGLCNKTLKEDKQTPEVQAYREWSHHKQNAINRMWKDCDF